MIPLEDVVAHWGDVFHLTIKNMAGKPRYIVQCKIVSGPSRVHAFL